MQHAILAVTAAVRRPSSASSAHFRKKPTNVASDPICLFGGILPNLPEMDERREVAVAVVQSQSHATRRRQDDRKPTKTNEELLWACGSRSMCWVTTCPDSGGLKIKTLSVSKCLTIYKTNKDNFKRTFLSGMGSSFYDQARRRTRTTSPT